MTGESMRCRNCGAALEAAHIDRRLGIVTCAHCGGLHELAGAAGGVADGVSPSAAAAGATAATGTAGRERANRSTTERSVVPMPSRFDVLRGDGTLQVRWPAGRKVGALVLVGFALVWAFAAVSSGLLFLAPVSLLLLYVAAVRAVNRTTLRVDGTHLSVRQGPLPWPGTRRLARADIAQLLASERVTRTRSGSNGDGAVRERRRYRLQTLDRSGRKRLVVSGLSSPAQALWLEHEIETLLGIENVAVVGEYRRR